MNEKEELERLIADLKAEYDLGIGDIAREADIPYITLAMARSGKRPVTNVLEKIRKLAEDYGLSEKGREEKGKEEQAPDTTFRRFAEELVRNIRAITIPPQVIQQCARYIRLSDDMVKLALRNPEVADYIVVLAARKYREHAQQQHRYRQGDDTPPVVMQTINPLAWILAEGLKSVLVHTRPALKAPENVVESLPSPSVKYIPSATKPFPKLNRPLLKYSDARCPTCPLVPPIGINAQALSDFLYDNPCPRWERHEC